MKNPVTPARKLGAIAALVNTQTAPDGGFLIAAMQLGMMALFGPTRLQITGAPLEQAGLGVTAAGNAERKGVHLGAFKLHVSAAGQGSAELQGVPLLTLTGTPGRYAFEEVSTREAHLLRLRSHALVSLGARGIRPQSTNRFTGQHLEVGLVDLESGSYPYRLRQDASGEGLVAVQIGRDQPYLEAARSFRKGGLITL